MFVLLLRDGCNIALFARLQSGGGGIKRSFPMVFFIWKPALFHVNDLPMEKDMEL